jgi:hypothetical protein
MKRLSWGCVVIGAISIVLAILNTIVIFLPPKYFSRIINNLLFNGCGEFVQLFLPVTYWRTVVWGTTVVFANFFQKSTILNVFVNFIGYIFTIVLAISGIGTIWVRPWGKAFSYIYATVMIFLAIIGLVIVILFPARPILAASAWEVKMLEVEVYIIFTLCALLYPIILLIFFTRPKLKEQFK